MRIGAYEVGIEIGRGGSGRVYRARAPGGGEVAIKVLLERRPEVVARFAREARLLAELDEASGFVPLLETGSSPGLGPWLVMPFLAGGTLRARLALGPIAPGDALELGVALARALGRAHERGIVHRDVKPENVLFARRGSDDGGLGRPLLADLGLAKHFGEALDARASVSLSRSGDFRGTASYMAPEQLRDAKSAGPEADVFALGAVLYEALAGRPPFEAASLVELAGRLESGAFEPLARIAPNVPRALALVVERALAREPAARFPDGRAFALALEATREPAERPRRRGLALVATIALGLVGATALVALRSPARAPVPPVPPAPTPARTPSPSSEEAAHARARALVVRAWARHHDNDVAATLELANQAIDVDPGCAEALALRALVRLLDGDTADAEGDVTKACALEPRLPVARVALANLCLARSDLEGAARAASRAVELDPRSVLGLLARAQAAGGLGDDDGALADLSRIVELDPSYVVARLLRSKLREKRGDWDGVIADTTVIVESKAQVPPRTLGMVRARRANARLITSPGDPAAAIADAEAAVTLAPDDPAFLLVRGRARSSAGRDAEALEDARASLALDPKSVEGWAFAALECFALEKDDETRDAATHALALDPRSTDAFLVRGSALQRQGHLTEARQDFERCLAIANPESLIAKIVQRKLDKLRAAAKGE